MGNSLFDQLKETGLVDKNTAKQVRKQKHKQSRQQKGKHRQLPDDSKIKAQHAREEKAARDRELNHQQQMAADKKASVAQIKQLVDMNRIEHNDGDINFNFVDGKKVQKLFVTEKTRNELVRGKLAIIKLASGYALVPVSVADKIALRDSSCVIVCNEEEKEISSTDDPYAEYAVPDDLMW